MEEFIQREAKDLELALSKGVEISWPESCRNCDFEFPLNLKSLACKKLLSDPLADTLKIVSSAMRDHCTGYNYCCVNNFKPTYRNHFTPPISRNTSYRICTETIMIEEGLDEWYDVTWDEDEGVGDEQRDQAPQSEFSLFNVVPS